MQDTFSISKGETKAFILGKIEVFLRNSGMISEVDKGLVDAEVNIKIKVKK